jgi:hypothetical protein
MSEARTASSVQTLVQRPGPAEPQAGIGDVAGAYSFGGFLLLNLFSRSLTIEQGEDAYVLKINDSTWGTLIGEPNDPGPWRFGHGEEEYIYVALSPLPHEGSSKYITITYLQYDLANPSVPVDPAATGVWLGTSSGGTPYQPVKA